MSIYFAKINLRKRKISLLFVKLWFLIWILSLILNFLSIFANCSFTENQENKKEIKLFMILIFVYFSYFADNFISVKLFEIKKIIELIICFSAALAAFFLLIFFQMCNKKFENNFLLKNKKFNEFFYTRSSINFILKKS